MAKRIQRKAPPVRAQESPQGGARKAASGGGGLRGRVKASLVTDFTVQLATLSEAGIPVVKALTILEGQTRPGPFKRVLADLVEDVASGTPLSEALGKHGRAFDPLYSSMVRAGEAGGVLDRILQRLADFREKKEEIKGKIRNAMIYPAVISVVAAAVVSVVIVWVIPRFQEIFESFGIALPGITQLLLDISSFVVKFWYLVFGLPVVLLVLHGFMMRRSRPYRRSAHALLLRIPVIGRVVSRGLVSSFARTFGTLVQAGVPHLDALAIVRDATANEVLMEGVEDIRRTVREGEGIARPMGETRLFDDLVVNMVDVGEETGELDRMLLRVADAYEKQLDRQIDAMFKIVEPALIIVMAAVVGFVVVALFLPLVEVMGSIGTQGR
jgi:type IV pilus assembly protein PilC